MTISFWTPELKQEVFELWKDHTATQIAAKMAREKGLQFTRNQIIGVVHRAGLGVAQKEKIHPRTRTRIFNGAERRMLKRTPRLRVVVSNPTPQPICEELPPLHLTFAEIGFEQCRYIYGDTPGETYCGHPEHKRSLCAFHFDLCYILPRKHHPQNWRAA
jgi:hypothetical protein